MFKKILIANRGEIACRVIKTARRMGIATVAVYSDADRDALHVEMADEAVCIGAAPARESYLDGAKIIAACRETGAEAIHPGYGFLSENEAFAAAVAAAGLVFIGPTPEAIAAMGDKIASKRLAKAAGVSTIPGHNEPIEAVDEAVAIARRIGYPVMIKASAGGGGKGLRVAFDDAEARDGFASCRKEAKNAFGDDRVFIEKFVEQPRHIEIQVLGDAQGNVVHLWERECSIQRRHQKLIEEAPSPFLTQEVREAMGAQAVALARAVDYRSAGTVEFVVGRDRSFYFLEMNTRLQVEHPVTESITGLDLVEQMIRVAAGEPLAFTQAEVKREGWAMECRINAEDPYRGYLPSTGRLTTFRPPQEVRGAVRVDSGVYEGGEIPIHYDSMIAKLITSGADRDEAARRMQSALDAFVIRGVASSTPLQASILRHPDFLAGDFDTGFLTRVFPEGFHGLAPDADERIALAAVAAALHHCCDRREIRISGQLPGHPRVIDGRYEVLCAEGRLACEVSEIEGGERVLIDGVRHTVAGDWQIGAPRFDGWLDGAPFVVQIERRGLDWRLMRAGLRVDLKVLGPRAAALFSLMPRKEAADLSQYLLSPMPGLLSELAVTVGQEIKAGERLATIEAMKMENILRAERDTVVAEILARPGESLAVDQPILRFAQTPPG
ncbi:acetyl-CoA carboxylase biotin carboxylase subunit [Niveibacterium sp. SC-1]|uniref:acetyl-CoA carboxylase biotin carboxylase subunit n=1 Tax=Niveibacterium sp. SC-1 TaxID=3135646 RepID=UPI00311EFB14